jgi:hypothetical protein
MDKEITNQNVLPYMIQIETGIWSNAKVATESGFSLYHAFGDTSCLFIGFCRRCLSKYMLLYGKSQIVLETLN